MGYVRALSRHRGALFSQGSQSQPGSLQDEFRKSAMKFFVSSVGLVDDRQLDARAWETRLSLLRMAEQENTFDSKQQESVLAINRVLDLIVIALNDSWKSKSPYCVLYPSSLHFQCRRQSTDHRNRRPVPLCHYPHRLRSYSRSNLEDPPSTSPGKSMSHDISCHLSDTNRFLYLARLTLSYWTCSLFITPKQGP